MYHRGEKGFKGGGQISSDTVEYVTQKRSGDLVGRGVRKSCRISELNRFRAQIKDQSALQCEIEGTFSFSPNPSNFGYSH